MIYIYLVLLLILFVVLVCTLGFDLFLHFRSVFYRIHIGRWTDRKAWLQEISNINSSWLQKTPTVKLTDNSRYVILDILKGKYRTSSIQSWQEGGMLFGAISSTTGADVSSDKIDRFINNKIDMNSGSWKSVPEHIDGVILGYALSKSVKDVHKIKPALDDIIALVEKCKGDDGTVFYRDFIPDIRFVDTIGFICPFLTFYGVKFDKPEYIDLAFYQIDQYLEKAFLKDISIPSHAFDIKCNMPLGIYGWGRGLGWFILGIVDMYNELPDTHQRKEWLQQLLINTANDTLPFQRENGSFGAMLAVKNYRHDSSITALAGWLFLNTYYITKDNKYADAADKCITSLMKVTRRNGVIDFCQGDTKGIGDYAKTFDLMPFVQGLTIRLVTSYERIKS